MEAFARMAHAISVATGSIYAFTGAMLVIALWAVLGPVFHYSDSWQLTVNTGTTIVTFLMVFVIQHAQNHDTRAIQLKLDELISAIASASNEIIEVENLSEAQIEVLYQRYQKAARAKAADDAEDAQGAQAADHADDAKDAAP